MKPAVYTNRHETVMTLDAFKAADFMSVWKVLQQPPSPEYRRELGRTIRRLKRREARKRERLKEWTETTRAAMLA